MTDVLDRALEVCQQHGGTKVTKITLKIGVMSGIVASYVQSFFDVLSKGTAAAGAEIVIEDDPAVFICRKCGAETVYTQHGPEYFCGDKKGDRKAILPSYPLFCLRRSLLNLSKTEKI